MKNPAYYKERWPLLFNLAMIATIILILAVAAHLVMQIGTRHGARRTVPDFAGMPSRRPLPRRKNAT